MGVSEPPVNPWSLTERVKVTSAADEMEYQVSARRVVDSSFHLWRGVVGE
jgi:hypothetical protein